MNAPATARPRLVLASGSPRRRQLLGDLGLEFEVRPPDADETQLAGESPGAMVTRLARDKALMDLRPGEVHLAADTTVVVDGRVLGKPVDAAEARAMLAAISGRDHIVFSGVAVARLDGGPRVAIRLVETRVTMRALDAREIADYVASGEPLDKAGAYGIQGLGSLLVAAVDGNYLNVVGLPLPAVAECFAELGLELLDFRK